MSSNEALNNKGWFRRERDTLYLSIQIQTRAGKDEIAGIRNGRLLLRIKTPPVDGKANLRLLEFLAERLHVPRSRLKIVQGEHNRYKVVAVSECGIIDPGVALFAASR
jgi:uncharacterized protein (TIGR00251 family)